MVIIGIVLLLIGLFAHVPLLFWLGLVCVVAGLILNFLGPVDAAGSRRRYY